MASDLLKGEGGEKTPPSLVRKGLSFLAKCFNYSSRFLCVFERELALLVALQGESSWKGAAAAAGWEDIH